MEEAKNKDRSQSSKETKSISGDIALCAFVEKLHLFKRISQEDMSLVYAAGKYHKYKAGEIIVKEGEPGEDLFLLVSGDVQVVSRAAGVSVELGRLSRGAIFGEVGFLTRKPRTAMILALNSVEIISFSRTDLDLVLQKYPKVRKTLQTMMTARAEKTIEALERSK